MKIENDQNPEELRCHKVNKGWWARIRQNRIVSMCIVFIISGSMNYGITGFKLVFPFMLISLIFMLFEGWNNVVRLLLFFLAAYIWNSTLIYNPLLFPVVAGSLEIQKDGFMVLNTYEKIPYYRSEMNYNAFMKEHQTGLDIISKVKKGDKINVSYIIPQGGLESINGSVIITPVGKFDQDDFINKEVKSQFPLINNYTKYLDVLMYYPVLLIGLYVLVPYLSYLSPFLFFIILPLGLWFWIQRYGNKEDPKE